MNEWREACAEAVRERSEPDAIRFWGRAHHDGETQRPVFDYRFEHTLACVRLARWLAPRVGADPEVVECAAWLHDCMKFLQDARSKDLHAEEGAAAVPAILSNTDFPPGKVAAVQHAIRHHVGLHLERRLTPVETACLWDADKLSKLGAASLVHFGCISGAFQPITTAEILKRGQAWLKLAQGIVDSMNTVPARVEAERRLAFITRHYRQLAREWADPMEDCHP